MLPKVHLGGGKAPESMRADVGGRRFEHCALPGGGDLRPGANVVAADKAAPCRPIAIHQSELRRRRVPAAGVRRDPHRCDLNAVAGAQHTPQPLGLAHGALSPAAKHPQPTL